MPDFVPGTHLWLRDESKSFERRTPLTPGDANRLIRAGFQLTVESSPARIFPDAEYRTAGCTPAASGSWRAAPKHAFILGLKELPEEEAPLVHRHIYFAHVYKNQAGWEKLLSRFVRGNGLLLDLEYLTDDRGRRVAAFGKWAGFSGAALGVDLWSHLQLNGGAPYPKIPEYHDRNQLVTAVKGRLDQAMRQVNRKARVLIIGSRGRCGGGALEFLKSVGLLETATGWDLAETAKGGPFAEILDFEILVNCVLVQGALPPFLTEAMLESSGSGRLRVISDVSCDPKSPFNPLPVYQETTTFQHPVLRLKQGILLTAIDHLPALLSRESSEDFSAQLFPSLLELETGSAVWSRAAELFQEKSRQ